MDATREKQAFEVFLSHNSQDKPAVRALAALLRERGTEVGLDEEQLTPRGLLTRALIEKHGYGRRKEELTDAKQAILRKPETDSP
jgi:hypothetical protein